MSPVVVEAEVDISRPPEEVFDYCSDHRHEPELATRHDPPRSPAPLRVSRRALAESQPYVSGDTGSFFRRR
jgi:hypothetical protein